MRPASRLFLLLCVGTLVDEILATVGAFVSIWATSYHRNRLEQCHDDGNRLYPSLSLNKIKLSHWHGRKDSKSNIRLGAASGGFFNKQSVNGITTNTNDDFVKSMDRLGLPTKIKIKIQDILEQKGLLIRDDSDDRRTNGYSETAGSINSDMLLLLARDFVDRPEAFATLLRDDFGLDSLLAHQTRAIVMDMINQDTKIETQQQQKKKSKQSSSPNDAPTTRNASQPLDENNGSTDSILVNGMEQDPSALPLDSKNNQAEDDTVEEKWIQNAFKKVVVDEKAKRRRAKANSSSTGPSKSNDGKSTVADSYDYGLPRNYKSLYPKLASELEEFYRFMTQPTPYAQEDPIREATAKVYIRHAKLFLGWYLNKYSQMEQQNGDQTGDQPKSDHDGMNQGASQDDQSTLSYNDRTVSLFEIIPNKEKDSATPLIDFILWLRSARDVSVSYESNMLRGLIKLLKYRFARESRSDSNYSDGGKVTFDDIPIIRELRKIHRNANQRQQKAPRSSNEERKWLTWPEYLGVVQSTKKELQSLLQEYYDQNKSTRDDNGPPYSRQQIAIAAAYQRYLILAILANVPDRQRTIRELELGRTFVKSEESSCWAIKHGPEDYKTGKSYGERPPMHLAKELTPAIDDFVSHWRRCLDPSTDFLFVQGRGGKPLTADSVYRRVCESCFKYSGKRTNPHLIRDMLVTHVREAGNASESQLEALALFMGHSIQMQRTSYDRRTLTKKIAPAVELMQSVNQNSNDD